MQLLPHTHMQTHKPSLLLLQLLQVYQLDGTSLASISSVESGSGFKCSTFGASSISDPQLATGGFDGKLQLWDLEKPKTPVWDAQAHASIVNGIDGFGGQVRDSGGSAQAGVCWRSPILEEGPGPTMQKQRECVHTRTVERCGHRACSVVTFRAQTPHSVAVRSKRHNAASPVPTPLHCSCVQAAQFPDCHHTWGGRPALSGS